MFSAQPSNNPGKRRKTNDQSWYSSLPNDFDEQAEYAFDNEYPLDMSLDYSIFALDDGQITAPADEALTENERAGCKRALDDEQDFFLEPIMVPSGSSLVPWMPKNPDQVLLKSMPQLFPSVPNLEDRSVDLNLENPFAENIDTPRHQNLARRKASQNKDVAVNGYIKIRVRASQSALIEPRRQGQFGSLVSQPEKSSAGRPLARIPGLPPQFGRGVTLCPMDEKILKFYLVCYCEGRTLLPKNNLWLRDITPMIAGSECVKHCLLAFASTYVLDFVPEQLLQAWANCHYAKAAKLLDQELRKYDRHLPGKEESLIASLMLMLGDDIVNWEIRKSKHVVPRWWAGAKAARAILDHSDPGYRYSMAENVQSTMARKSLSNWVAFVHILAEPVIPLTTNKNGCNYSWLIQGGKHETREIHGGTGTCPKLLHIFGQITHLTERLKDRPDSPILLLAAKRLELRLQRFHQWSDLNKTGYHAHEFETLVTDCQAFLDPETGKANSPAFVTDLTGQAWVATAQMYLHCRFYRKPRSHPDVRAALSKLIRCTELMPFRGPLFTAQAPFFPIFMMGLLSLGEDRRTAHDWFETICGSAGERSSVPPIWESLKRIWNWMDGHDDGTTALDTAIQEAEGEWIVSSKLAWWEQMVDWIIENEGYLSLV